MSDPTNVEKRLARVGDRFLAFLLDFWLFTAGYYASVAALIYGLGREPGAGPRIILALAWYALFSFYQARMLSRSGATFGKRLLGIAVMDAEGNPPAFKAALSRSWGYLASSAPLNLGFLWALFQAESRAWHDLLAGTYVFESREKGPLSRAALSFLSVAMLIFLVLSSFWVFLAGPRFYDIQKVANAQSVLDSLASMQDSHKTLYGTHAHSLNKLVSLTRDQQGFVEALKEVLDLDAGVAIEADDRTYHISARARDDKATLVEVWGPQRRKKP